jgi:hypothetical protein
MVILYKQPDDSQSQKLINYLKSLEKVIVLTIVEDNFPNDITQFPSLMIDEILYQGFNKIILHYQKILKIDKLLKKINSHYNKSKSSNFTCIPRSKTIFTTKKF